MFNPFKEHYRIVERLDEHRNYEKNRYDVERWYGIIAGWSILASRETLPEAKARINYLKERDLKSKKKTVVWKDW